MLRSVSIIAQWGLIGITAYTLGVSLFGWRTPGPSPRGPRRRRMIVVVPAHDEERVIGGIVTDLVASDLDPSLREIWVVADRCSDGTAAVAATAGARVVERSSGAVGKGAALSWFLERHPIDANAGLVVLDADNRIDPSFLGGLSDELDAGHEVVQAYLDVIDPAESWLTLASAVSYWSANRMVHLAHSNLGWPVDLGGTGSCISGAALEAAGGFEAALVEDTDLATRLTLAGIRTSWAHHLRVRDEKPATAAVAISQRGRWLAGRRSVARSRFWPLLRHGLRTRRWGPVDQALRLVRPSRTIGAAAAAVLAAAAAITGSSILLRWEVWAVLAVLQMLWPIPFLLRDHVPLRYVTALPLLGVFVVLWAPIRFAASRTRGWSRTPHRGGATPPGDQTGDESDSV